MQILKAGSGPVSPRSKRKGERIAKYLARAGIASRREVERMIEAGRVSVNGTVIDQAAVLVTGNDRIVVDGTPVRKPQATRIWLYNKPAGLISTHSDPQGRDTIFNHLPKFMPRVISVGRLDMNSEGLLLLTNSGALARYLELPAHAFERTYRVRVYGEIKEQALDSIRGGIEIEGIKYAPAKISLDSTTSGANQWLHVVLQEGKNREIRKLFGHVKLEVNRLIRVAYGPFELTDLKKGELREVNAETLAGMFETELHHELGIQPPRPAGVKTTEKRRDHSRPKKFNTNRTDTKPDANKMTALGDFRKPKKPEQNSGSRVAKPTEKKRNAKFKPTTQVFNKRTKKD